MKKKNVTKPVENKNIAEIKADALALKEKIEALTIKEMLGVGEVVLNIARDIRWFLEDSVAIEREIGKKLKALKKLK